MIQPQTCLRVADNSGAKKLMCIRVLGSNRRYGFVGDVIRAVIVRTKHSISRNDGTRLRFDDNASVIINKENNPRGTRVFGSIARELKEKGFTKIVSLAPEVL